MPIEVIDKILRNGIGSDEDKNVPLEMLDNRIRWGATYYTLLLENFPIHNKSKIIKKSRERKRPLNNEGIKAARNILLKRGLIAQVFFSDAQIDEKIEFSNDIFNNDKFEQIFGVEPFLPANPLIICDANKSVTEEFKDDVKEKLEKIYKMNFGDNGFVKKGGIVSVLYSSHWFTYTILNNLLNSKSKNIYLTLSGLSSFSKPFNIFYENAISSENAPQIKALFDPTPYANDKIKAKKFVSCLENAIKFLNKGNNNDYIEIRYTSSTHGTSRRAVSDDMAIDANKIIPFDRDEPTYYGVIYQETNEIDYLKKNFQDKWNEGKDIIEWSKERYGLPQM